MRDDISASLKDALEAGDKRRAATLRLILTAIKDREAAARDCGRDGITDEEVHQFLKRMLAQREESRQAYEEAGQVELAVQEEEESQIIREFLPRQMGEDEMRRICAETIADIEAQGLRDIGRCMNSLKERYPGQMDFVQASCLVKDLLRTRPGDS
ncbi:GatB/YqeY domain-containing protein [Pannonibacter sp. Q-1]|uniref:Glutamyl-tRNA amidotransferase n=1 Tax=Pannonibacter phragmitetus TaxID=121719 RepID=A0A0L0ITM2_9HYPH|nr:MULTISPECIES: GatB/YqeY domain-containing protein [Pannonibacter]ALV28022.1 glutamyl-tRNA amidotransferase [Pannonibacter phragmitetus]KND16797.1 glutamyl-tRNA amidotransferase [Pannonibacter phragmitetus]MBA4203882.1 DNA primase [Polymorphum sp.]